MSIFMMWRHPGPIHKVAGYFKKGGPNHGKSKQSRKE